jgi:hypothetical protein
LLLHYRVISMLSPIVGLVLVLAADQWHGTPTSSMCTSSFPTDLGTRQYLGLFSVGDADTQDKCCDACAGDDNCLLWNWCDKDSPCASYAGGCFMGQSDLPFNDPPASEGFLARSRAPPTPAPPTPAPPTPAPPTPAPPTPAPPTPPPISPCTSCDSAQAQWSAFVDTLDPTDPSVEQELEAGCAALASRCSVSVKCPSNFISGSGQAPTCEVPTLSGGAPVGAIAGVAVAFLALGACRVMRLRKARAAAVADPKMPNDAAYVTMGGECAAAAAYTPAAVAAPQPTAAAAASCAGCNNAYLELDLTLSTGTTFCSNCGQRM